MCILTSSFKPNPLKEFIINSVWRSISLYLPGGVEFERAGGVLTNLLRRGGEIKELDSSDWRLITISSYSRALNWSLYCFCIASKSLVGSSNVNPAAAAAAAAACLCLACCWSANKGEGVRGKSYSSCWASSSPRMTPHLPVGLNQPSFSDDG